VISTYSPPTKKVSFREYEPVQASLHPALVSSGEFDDPSMDEKVASASVRLDLLQRYLKISFSKLLFNFFMPIFKMYFYRHLC